MSYVGLGADVGMTVLQQAAGSASGAGRALTESLENVGDSISKTAQKYVNEATAFYNEISKSAGNKSDAEVAQHFFLRGMDVLDRGAAFAQQIGVISGGAAKDVADTVAATRDALNAGFSLAGEGGTLDKIKAVDTMIKSMIKIANVFGADQKVTEQLQQWSEVGTSCASMIAASAGPMLYVGIAGCAAQVLLQALSYAAPATTTTPPGVPYAYLTPRKNIDEFRPEVSQTTIIARDAMLLAQVFKYHYGMTSSAPIYNALCGNTLSGSRPGTEKGLWSRTVQAFGTYNNALAGLANHPAVDLTSMLLAVSALDHEPVSVDETQNDLIEIGARACEREWDEGCHCTLDAKTGETSCGGLKLPSYGHALGIQYYADAGELNQAGIAIGASFGRGCVAQGRSPGSLLKFIRVDELINYFYAVSLTQRRQDEDLWRLEVDRYLTPALPIQFNALPERIRSSLWTHLDIMCPPAACGSPIEFFIGRSASAAEALRQRIKNDWAGEDIEAQREFAALRLMTAMSYLIRGERHSAVAQYAAAADPIVAGGPVTVGSVAWEAQMPIDPRQVVYDGGRYVANTYGGRHPWEQNLDPAAEIRQHSGSAWLQALTPMEAKWATTAGVHYPVATYPLSSYRSQTTRDGRWLAWWIQARENHYRDLITRAFRAAAATMTAPITLMAAKATMPELGFSHVGMESRIQAAIQSDPRFQMQRVGDASVKYKSNCEAQGGYVVQDADPFTGTVRDFCKPSQLVELACLESGGTPTWDTVNGYKCVKGVGAGVGGGGGAGIFVLAGAALLLVKYLKK